MVIQVSYDISFRVKAEGADCYMVKEHGGLYARTKLMEAASKITGIEITPIHEEEMMKARIENEANGIYFPPDDPDKW